MDNPTLKAQTLRGDVVGIHIAEAIEESHDTARTEDQAQNDTDGEQAVVWLVHDAVDSLFHEVERPRGDEEIVEEHHHPLIEVRNGNIGYQREEEQD